jgi:hypothetical protein
MNNRIPAPTKNSAPMIILSRTLTGRVPLGHVGSVPVARLEVVDAFGRGPHHARAASGEGSALRGSKTRGSYCAVVAFVSVEENVQVHKLWAAVDPGLVIKPASVVSQIEGGMLQAASWVLKEAVPIDGTRLIAESWKVRRPRTWFSRSRLILTSNARLASSALTKWLSISLTCTSLNQPVCAKRPRRAAVQS